MLTLGQIDPVALHGHDDRVMAFVKGLYQWVDQRIDHAAPTCRKCKTCCDFGRSDHHLFITNIELAYFAAHVDRIRPARRHVCPYLDPQSLCTVRAIRPIGCRAFFCQPTKGYDPAAVTEEGLARIKRFVEQANLRYDYCEWLTALTSLAKGHPFNEIGPASRAGVPS